MKVYTIGFTKKSAEAFFNKLLDARVKRVIDIRLNNVSQLAGFAKKDDLKFFLQAIGGIEYVHKPELAPTQALLDSYRKEKMPWAAYAPKFLKLMASRKIEELISRELLDGACLLCSEDEATHCHRSLVAEYLKKQWGDLEVVHL